MIHHEFWPTSLLHLPVYIYALGQALRFRSLNYFVWANPKIATGGLKGYSRYKILQHVPESHLPATVLVFASATPEDVEKLWSEKGGAFPIVVKPDLGGSQGFGVKLINDQEELLKYHKKVKYNYLIQTYVDEPEEFGVFVLRTSEGFQISSLVQKDFLILHGDGRSSIKELFYKHGRASQFISVHELPHYSERILEVGQNVWLQPLGSRRKGTRFVNANSIIDESLTDHFQILTKHIPQFFYGRLEVRAESVRALSEGRFKVMDISGVGSVPGHIYDSGYKWTQAIKDILWHWKRLSDIVNVNRKRLSKESASTTYKTIFFSKGSDV
ncbi:MAG: hypothetical protein M9899_08340 [Bdellovibrionaceae bacterium]|nr:hypothetical protein [Pseudobdellovibrionaceae bacterium]